MDCHDLCLVCGKNRFAERSPEIEKRWRDAGLYREDVRAKSAVLYLRGYQKIELSGTCNACDEMRIVAELSRLGL